MDLYTACRRYGAPEQLVSESGGAYTPADFEAVCTRLQIHHETTVSTQGESHQNLMETHFNIQRRLCDYQFSLARTHVEFEQCHRTFTQTYNTTTHEGLLKDRRLPPSPGEVLGTAKGRAPPRSPCGRSLPYRRSQRAVSAGGPAAGRAVASGARAHALAGETDGRAQRRRL
jgi:hypothetical protein